MVQGVHVASGGVLVESPLEAGCPPLMTESRRVDVDLLIGMILLHYRRGQLWVVRRYGPVLLVV